MYLYVPYPVKTQNQIQDHAFEIFYVTFKIEHEHNTIQILNQHLTPKNQLCKKSNTSSHLYIDPKVYNRYTTIHYSK